MICNSWHSLFYFRLLLSNALYWIFVCLSHVLFHPSWNYNNTCQGMWPISLNCPSLSLGGDVRQEHTYNVWRVYTLFWHIICLWKAFMSYIDSWSINYLVQMCVNCYKNPVFVAIYTLEKPNASLFSLQICTKDQGEILSNETEEEKTTQPSICSFTKSWGKRLVFWLLGSFNIKINTNNSKAADQHP